MNRLLRALSCAAVWLFGLPAFGAQDSIGHWYKFEGTGLPTVVFIAEIGSHDSMFSRADELLQSKARTLIYRRLGHAKSARTDSPRDAESLAKELRALLGELSISQPVVLVAKGNASLYAEYFARRWPREVAGLVFIDPWICTRLKLIKQNDPEWHRVLSFQMNSDGSSPSGAEWRFMDESSGQVCDLPPNSVVPTIVLRGVKRDGSPSSAWDAVWVKLDQEMLLTAPDSEQVLVRGAGWNFPMKQPDLVVDAVLKIVERGQGEARSLPAEQ